MSDRGLHSERERTVRYFPLTDLTMSAVGVGAVMFFFFQRTNTLSVSMCVTTVL